MIKKGKFKLLSYIVDEDLIFYKSLNRVKKYIGFFIMQATSFYPLISILNNLLNKRLICYYSIQINSKNTEQYFFFINIENNTKNETIKLWNLIKEEIKEKNCHNAFLIRNNLEKTFLEILDDDLNNNNLILKNSNELLLIKDKKNIRRLDFYTINFENLEDKSFFLSTFLNYIDNLNLFGYIILNFKQMENNTINISVYFTLISEKEKNLGNISAEINNFFNIVLLEKKKIRIKEIGHHLWRYAIFNNFYSFKDVIDLFKTDKHYDFKNLQTFNLQFEQSLLKNGIKFRRINENMVLIQEDILFITFLNCDPKVLLRIFKKFYSKYLLYILILNEVEYKDLLRIDINQLKKVVILDINGFLNLDLLVFKK